MSKKRLLRTTTTELLKALLSRNQLPGKRKRNQRDRLVVTVRKYGGIDLKKEWKIRGGTPELRLHLAQQGVSE
jgi:hypothetical protein